MAATGSRGGLALTPRHRPRGWDALTVRQVLALTGLRWRMVRRPWARAGLVTLVAVLPLGAVGAVAAGAALRSADPAAGAPGAGPGLVPAVLFASMAVMGVLAPLAAGGAHELYPSAHLVAFPVRPATLVSTSLLLAPLNLAWLTQVLGVLGAAGYLAGAGPGPATGAVAALAYVAFVSAAGQALAWVVVGLRHTAAGRAAVAAVAGAAAGAALAVGWSGRGRDAVTALPTSRAAELAGASGGAWAWGVAGLAAGTLLATRLAVPACAWALARGPDLSAGGEGRPVRRRSARRTLLAELAAVDRASVLRSAPLRRGVVVLALLPGLAAAVPSVEWASIVMLPGLVSAGTGLLFGVNVFCLDSAGALWLASLPHDPRLAYLAKARVLAEVCAGTALVAVALAVVRAPDAPTATQLLAVVGALVACPAAVVAACMRMSVRHPHRADLRSPRDTPAPPGAMVAYSLRLAGVTTLTAGLMSVFSYSPYVWVPVVGAVALTLRPVAAVARGADAWREPEPRARVVAAVSAG